MIGIGLVGAVFYAVVSNHFLGAIIGRTLGPYSDTLARHGFASPDPEIWRRMAETHDVAILIEPARGEATAFDERGRSVAPASLGEGPIRAVRTAEDGTRVTFDWKIGSFGNAHGPLLGGLLVMVTAVVGSAFWFLQRQLKPLALLRTGVDAVARGDFAARVPIVRDDEIGQIAGAFNAMTGRVGGMIDDRERLLADVSHELRSPLARMKVALEFLPPGDKRDTLARDVKEMDGLIGVLLEREGLRSRTDRLERRAIDLDTLTREVAAAFTGRGPGVEVVSRGAVEVHGDPALLALLIRNLIDNAVKFSHPDGRPVQVAFQREADAVSLSVSDDGIGIAPGNEERLFEPFVKADRARGHHAGYGIGLDLCRRIVRLHGGTIALHPRQPRGTRAVVELRVSEVPGGDGPVLDLPPGGSPGK